MKGSLTFVHSPHLLACCSQTPCLSRPSGGSSRWVKSLTEYFFRHLQVTIYILSSRSSSSVVAKGKVSRRCITESRIYHEWLDWHSGIVVFKRKRKEFQEREGNHSENLDFDLKTKSYSVSRQISKWENRWQWKCWSLGVCYGLTRANIYTLFSFPLLREWVVLENWWHHHHQQEEQVRKGGVYKMGTKCPRLTCFKWLGDASSTFHPEWAQATEDQMSHMIQFCAWLFCGICRGACSYFYKSTHNCEGASSPLFWLEPVGWWDFEWGGIGPSLLVGQVIPYI